MEHLYAKFLITLGFKIHLWGFKKIGNRIAARGIRIAMRLPAHQMVAYVKSLKMPDEIANRIKE